ncbi:MAG: hypothetical protein II557_02075 [Clostridia bacterium]|nr:hypothetical protein [Clostridia bacterium]
MAKQVSNVHFPSSAVSYGYAIASAVKRTLLNSMHSEVRSSVGEISPIARKSLFMTVMSCFSFWSHHSMSRLTDGSL